MKKIMYALLILMLFSGNTFNSLAEKTSNSTNVFSDDSLGLRSAAQVGGNLYLSGEELYKLSPHENEIISLTIELANNENTLIKRSSSNELQWSKMLLFSYDELLYALNISSGIIYNIEIKGQIATLYEETSIDLEPLRNMAFGGDGYIEPPAQIIVQDDVMYIISNTQDMNGDIIKLLSYDILNGWSFRERKAKFIQQLCTYKDGKMIALVMDPNTPFDINTQQRKTAVLCVYDPLMDTLETLCDTEYSIGVPCTSGIAYDELNNRVYMQGNDQVFYWDNFDKKQVFADLIPVESYGNFCGRMFLLSPSQIAVIDGRGIFIRTNESTQDSIDSLRIYGGHMDEGHNRAIKGLTNITNITFIKKEYKNAGELGQGIAVGDDDFDILILKSDSMNLLNFMSKGFSADLSESMIIQNYMSNLYPIITEAGMYDNSIFMVPVGLEMYGILSFSPTLIDQIEGVRVPKTFEELLKFIQTWNDELNDKHPDILPYASIDYRAEMSGLAIELQTDVMALQDKDFDFHDPYLKEMLISAAKLKTSNILSQIDWFDPEAAADIDALYSKKAIIRANYGIDLELISETLNANSLFNIGYDDMLPMPIAIREGEKPTVAVNVIMMAVNPNSKNFDSAVSYIESYVNNLDAISLSMMNPSLNEAIINPYYEMEIKAIDEELDRLKSLIKNVEGAQRRELEAEYEAAEAYYAQRKVDRHFIVLENAISLYRSLLDNAYVQSRSGVEELFADDGTRLLFNRYVSGQIALDEFLDEADRKLRIIRLEAE